MIPNFTKIMKLKTCFCHHLCYFVHSTKVEISQDFPPIFLVYEKHFLL